MSSKLRAYVVDDEPLALRRLMALLEETGKVAVEGGTTDPGKAIDFLSHHSVDVLFLDIQMPEMTGFELVEKLLEQPAIVFTTAYNRYALKAFEVNSIDYLLKPIEAEQLDRALLKLERLRRGAEVHLSPAQLKGVLEELRAGLEPKSRYPSRIASRLGGRVLFIDLSQVTHFFAEDKLTYAATPAKSWIVDGTLSDLERKLDPKQFMRIHRATLINLAEYPFIGGRERCPFGLRPQRDSLRPHWRWARSWSR